MIPPPEDFVWRNRTSRMVQYFVASTSTPVRCWRRDRGRSRRGVQRPGKGRQPVGAGGRPQARKPWHRAGTGTPPDRILHRRGRSYLDLSVMHSNREAIRLYERLKFERINVFTGRTRNVDQRTIVHRFAAAGTTQPLRAHHHPRGAATRIGVNVLDAEAGFFELALGAAASPPRVVERVDHVDRDEPLRRQGGHPSLPRTRRPAGTGTGKVGTCRRPGVPRRIRWSSNRLAANRAPASASTFDRESLRAAIRGAQHCESVLLEEYVEGMDLRIIVIDGRVVAAATRRPPRIQGPDGHDPQPDRETEPTPRGDRRREQHPIDRRPNAA